MKRLTREQVYAAIDQERLHQDEKWGPNKPQSLPGYLVLARKELEEAELGWAKNYGGKHAPLNELVQVVAVLIDCLEKYGVEGSAISTDDQIDYSKEHQDGN